MQGNCLLDVLWLDIIKDPIFNVFWNLDCNKFELMISTDYGRTKQNKLCPFDISEVIYQFIF